MRESIVLFCHSIDWVATTSIILCGITFWYAYLTRKLLKNQIQPIIVIYVDQSPRQETILRIIVENIGNGTAYNISFTSSKPIPDRAYGINYDGAKMPDMMNSGPLINGIHCLVPNRKVVIEWGQYGTILKGLDNDMLEIFCFYHDGSGQKMPKASFVLNIKDFERTMVETDPDLQKVNEFKKINQNFKELTRRVSTNCLLTEEIKILNSNLEKLIGAKYEQKNECILCLIYKKIFCKNQHIK